jgi:hypothetical protein
MQNPAKSGQARAKSIKEKALDFLFRIEPFQSVAATPAAKILSPLLPLRVGLPRSWALHSATSPLYHGFRFSPNNSFGLGEGSVFHDPSNLIEERRAQDAGVG